MMSPVGRHPLLGKEGASQWLGCERLSTRWKTLTLVANGKPNHGKGATAMVAGIAHHLSQGIHFSSLKDTCK